MRSWVRFSFLALLVGVMVAVVAPSAQAAFGISRFFAANCNAVGEKCGETANPNQTEAETQGFRQAGGHPNFGVTDFTVKTNLAGEPEGKVTHVRTDVGPGVSTNPEAVPKCTFEQFGAEALPASGLFVAPACPGETKIGINKVTAFIPGVGPFNKFGPGANFLTASEEAPVFNLVQPTGLASEFGVALKIPKPVTEAKLAAIFKGSNKPVEEGQYYAHTLIEGNVEWASDYHDYFEINASPELPLIRSRLSFTGNIGTGTAPIGSGGFLTNPTSCNPPGPATTSKLILKTQEGATAEETYTALVGPTGCNLLPFAPTFSLTPETAQNDQPDGITANLGLSHDLTPTGIDSSQLKVASVTLPEGMTLNPSAAAGLGTAACTPAQIGIGTRNPVACPEASKVGTVTLDVPGLPAGSLQGNVYLGTPNANGIVTDSPYVMYVDAESARYGVSVRLKGAATPDLTTGRVTASFTENPEQPFSNLALHFKGGNLAPIANPLACGTATTQTVLTPFSGNAAAAPTSSFVVDANGKGGACAATIPFALAQSTVNQTTTAGGHTSFTFNLSRGDGNQYLSQVKTTLPEGLVGAIPAVTPCTEAQATANACPATSQIGQATAISGSGPTPFAFGGGIVYLTGPFQGAPYGLSIVVPTIAGPFNLGPVTTRATLNIDPNTARVITTAKVPTIVKGIPTRLRGLTIAINKQGFLFNPTSCSALTTESVLTSTLGATQSLTSPTQVGNCAALKFKPVFKATAGARTTKANGASLTTTITEPAGQANIKSVKVQLPLALPSRLTTLQKACTAAQFAVDPFKCPSGSFVGGATVVTPTLPGKMTGPAILVSHAGAAFPDLDLVLQSNGVRIILTGNTDIKKSITTTTFATNPDVPVSSVIVNLPIGSHSALAANLPQSANGSLCLKPLVMPTTIVAQNGSAPIKQNTKVSVSGCGVQVVGHKVVGNTAFVTVQTFAAGRISGKGAGAATVFRRLSKAQKTAQIRIPLTSKGRSKRKPLKVRLRVGFVPKAKGGKTSASFVTVTFR
jgi:hypothetical protein